MKEGSEEEEEEGEEESDEEEESDDDDDTPVTDSDADVECERERKIRERFSLQREDAENADKDDRDDMLIWVDTEAPMRRRYLKPLMVSGMAGDEIIGDTTWKNLCACMLDVAMVGYVTQDRESRSASHAGAMGLPPRPHPPMTTTPPDAWEWRPRRGQLP